MRKICSSPLLRRARYGAVLRGDQSSIYVGAYSSIGDRTVVQARRLRTSRAPTRRDCTNVIGVILVSSLGLLLIPACSLRSLVACAQSSAINPTGFSARTYIGDYVTIGQGCTLRACTVDDNSVIGDGCILQEGSLVDEGAMLEAGSLLPSGARVPSGQVYGGNPASFVRKLEKAELTEFQMTAEKTPELAAKHADEFLPYGEMYQLKAEMAAKAAK